MRRTGMKGKDKGIFENALVSGLIAAIVCMLFIGGSLLAQGSYTEIPDGGLIFRQQNPDIKLAGNPEFEKLDSPLTGNVNVNTAGAGHFRFNSRAFTATSGTSMGMQVKPDQTAVGASVTGMEVSPRYTDAGGGDLIGMKLDPVLKAATSARTVSSARALEINFDLPDTGSAYTITNDVSAVRVFPDFGSGHTFSGNRSILRAAAPNTSDWQYFMEAETGTNGWVVVGAGTYSTADGYILVRIHGSTYRIPFFAAVD